jgi:serine/threonine-protein kinase
LIQRCPTCGSFYRHEQVCQRDGTRLSPSDGVIDRYQIVDRVGVGGMGTVYKAMHTLLDNRIVAIKMLHRELSQNPEVVNRFFREAKAASRAENRHIVDVIDFGVTFDGDSFLVMEYLEGPSLRDVVDEGPPMPLSLALSIAGQIAEGLHAAHQRGIVHRDLKPENILLTRHKDNKRYVKLLDFGIAKLTEQQATNLTVAGMVVGTPTYMSPEQAGGEPVDHRADIYSLGTILYEMLTGKVPFTGETTKQILLAHLTQTPVPPRELRPEIPVTVEAVILHALEKDPPNRPESMYHLACELRDALKGQGPAPKAANGAPAPEPYPLPEMADPLESTFNVPLQSPLRRYLPFIGAGAGMILGIVITAVLMSRGGSTKTTSVDPQTKNAETANAKTAASEHPAAPNARATSDEPRHQVVSLKIRKPQEKMKRARHARRHKRHRTHAHRGQTPRKSKPAVSSKKCPKSHYRATVTSIPSGAKVLEGDTLLGRTPLKVDTGCARRVTVHLPGLEAKTVVLPRHSTARFAVKLEMATMSWEVVSLSKLKRLADQGKISKFTYKRRRAELIKRRDRNIMQLKVKLKLGHITIDQYNRAVQAEKEIYN